MSHILYPAMTIGETVKFLRNRLNISQDELAKKSSCSRNYISLIERDKADNISIKLLHEIFDNLGIKMEINFITKE